MIQISRNPLRLPFCILPLLFCIALTASTAKAQTHGYGFIGPAFSGAPGDFRYGIGGAWATSPHITLGGEVGGFNGTGPLISGNLGVHFTPKASFDPFVTGGISYAHAHSRNGVFANLGIGINYWFRPHIAMRGEYRGYLGGLDLKSFSEFRFGVAFR